ncbi:MAG: Tim44/TimA family putative adaptor protein [Pseudomonadota bacterium]
MPEFLDASTLILLVAAVLIFLRLRSVLGRRTGHEKPPFDYGARQQENRSDDNVVTLPPRQGAANGKDYSGDDDEDDAVFPWTGHAEPGSALADGFDKIADADPTFDPRSFIDGAKMAYEMIVTAFAEGDRKALRPLLSPDVFDGFVSVIDDREKRDERIESRFIGIEEASFVEADHKDGQAQVTVKFVSDLISATFDDKNELVEGDPMAVGQVTDIWTFARKTRSRDPNWQLIATEDDA